MKVKKIKRKKLPSIQKLTHKLDKAIQDYYRRNIMGCESCGKRAEVMHHHHPKSRSNYLRFDPDNLIYLCNSCHFKLHKGDPTIAYNYRQMHLPDWEKELTEKCHTYKKWSRDELNQLLQKYKL